jgi:hypothetical protein
MKLNRRRFLKAASAATASAVVGTQVTKAQKEGELNVSKSQPSYTYRIAFGAWINDMRNESLPLENWPAPQFDDETVDSAIRAMDVQSEAGYNMLDAFGLFATYGYPPDIVSAFADKEREARLKRLFKAASDRGIKMVLPMGLFTWGYDKIIEADPEVRGQDEAGNPHPHAMCGAKEKAWTYVEKIIDCAMERYEFGGVHLESADQGWCSCPECAGKYGVVGYNAQLNMRAADYIKSKWPDVMVMTIPINWVRSVVSDEIEPPRFNDDELEHIFELSKHIDVFMDQGHRGRFLPDEYVPRLECAYGTSGGLWLYHLVRWDRSTFFLPYPKRAAEGVRQAYRIGARACLLYQGPMANPGVELNSAVSGRALCDVERDPREMAIEVVERYYRPKSTEAAGKLADLFLRAEEGYFGQWRKERFAEIHRSVPPGEFKLNDALFGTSPGPATYLMEPYLDAEGRRLYKEELKAVLRDLAALDGQFSDGGRLEKMKRGMMVTLHLINTARYCKNEPWQD